MTTAQGVEMLVTVNNNCPIQDYVPRDDQTQPTFELTPGFKPFTIQYLLQSRTFLFFFQFVTEAPMRVISVFDFKFLQS